MTPTLAEKTLPSSQKASAGAPRPSSPSRNRTTRWRAGMTRAWQCVRTVAGRFPLTPLGILVIPLLIWIYLVFGRDREDYVLLALTVCGLVLVAAAVLQVVGTALWLRLRKQTPSAKPVALETGCPCRTGYRLGRLGWNPLIRIDVAWEQPTGVQVQLAPTWEGLAEEMTAGERCQHSRIVRRFTISDVLGLSRLSFTRPQSQKIEIRPLCGQPPALLQLPPQLIAGDEMEHPEGKPEGDLIEMRSFENGDSLKLILWKVYARTGQMLIRLPERSVSRSQKAQVYFVAGEGDEPSAGVARTVLETGLLGHDLVFGADGDPNAVASAPEAITRVVASVRSRKQGGEGLGAFLTRGANQGLKACLLFVPAQPGPWLESVCEHLSRHPGPFRILIGVDGLEFPPSSSWLKRMLFPRISEGGARATDVIRVCERLRPLALEVCVVNRATGETLDPARSGKPLS
jgi:Protein of unknown function DUF58